MNGSGAADLAVAGVSALLCADLSDVAFLAVSWAFAKAIHNTAHITKVNTFEKGLNINPPSKRNLAAPYHTTLA
jgi:hypothetical protein